MFRRQRKDSEPVPPDEEAPTDRKAVAVLPDRDDAASDATSSPAEPLDSGSAGPVISPDPTDARFGDLLVQRSLVQPDLLRRALDMQAAGKQLRLGDLLVELGAMDESVLVDSLADHLGLERADLRGLTPDPTALDLLPEAVARGELAVPLRLSKGVLDVAVADPSPGLGKRLEDATGHKVRLLIAPTSELRRVLATAYRILGEVGRLVQAFEATATPAAGGRAVDNTLDGDAPVIQVMNLLLTQALRDRASDIHIEPQDGVVRVRYRIDGALHDTLEVPAAMAPALVSRLKIMANLNIVERRRPQDGQITVEIDGREIDMRLSVLPTIWGEKCVIRLLDKTRALKKMGDLGMPPATHESFSRLIRAPFGMVLCAGPTGSGKTTTLYAALQEINEPHRNITTIEDPVEYVIPSLNQIHANEAVGMTFATGLKSILRQDPDVILVGEIRDAETARIAVQSALTGHFVLSTLHGTDAVAALHRLLDMGIESFLIASSVLAVVGQRLVRRICSSCKVIYKPTPEELAFYEESGGRPKDRFYMGTGCNICAGTGYQDRIGVYELLRVTPEIKRLVVGWATQEELRRLAESQGMRTLRQEAVALVERDLTTLSEVVRTIYAA